MSDLREGDFELDGVVWGDRGRALLCRDFTPSAVEIRTQDVEVPGGHGLNMGRDLMGGSTWAWSIATIRSDAEGALAEGERMAAVWRRYMNDPSALAALRYVQGGRARRVYGRPRRFAPPKADVMGRRGVGRIEATFDVADPLTYDDEAQSLPLSLAAEGGPGLRLPARLPWHLGARTGQRQGVVHVGGEAPTPFRLTFFGPVSGSASGFWAQGPGWRVDLNASIAWDQHVVVDTRAHTVTRSDGVSLAGAARGRFLSARLRPGAQEVSWGVADATLTARAELLWRPAFYSL